MLMLHATNLRKKVEFHPVSGGKDVTMYVCGPTVYDKGHLGHGRSAVAFDLIRRYLQYRGFAVKFVSNYTDIDDKMITRAAERGITVAELAAEIIPLYKRDFGKLHVMSADVSPMATEFVPQMIALIEELERKGFTYVISDGVYFDVSKFERYGALSGQNLADLQAGARKEVNEEKRQHQDFVLWKFAKPGEPAWDSAWGSGRPGWHIECSAMVREILGQPIDIHGGGLDLTFPHHECEVAQSEAAYGVEFAKYWIHNGFVTMDKEKMSKSLHNFVTLEDVLKVYEGRVVRFLYLQTHYRSPLDFSENLLEQSKNGLARIDQFVALLKHYSANDASFDVAGLIERYRDEFVLVMDNDIDISGALGVLFQLISECNELMSEKKLSGENITAILDFVHELNSVLSILKTGSEDELPAEIQAMIDERETARKARNFAKSDELRDAIVAKGYVIEDTPSGVMVRKG